MSGPRRSGRRVALLARYPDRDPAMPQFIPNLGLYMVEASLRAAGLDDLEARVWDLPGGYGDVEGLTAEIIAYDPDVIGFSAFLWSFPLFLAVAARLKAEDPTRLIVFGGPSARPAMLDLAPHREKAAAIDLLVVSEGERAFAEIVALRDRSDPMVARVPGTVYRAGGRWREAPPRPPADLDDLASPYAAGLVPKGGLALLQTYRGCPFTCSFCEWGVMEQPKNVRSCKSLTAEFAAFDRSEVQGVLLADAGLNLNTGAFNNLAAAAKETGFFRRRGLIAEVYPAKVRREHLDFLAGVGTAYVGVGLQSFDADVLAQVDRKYDEARFEATLDELSAVAALAVEIIMGLPGDSPARFRRNFERARRLPAALRVYHCVVLPSALMTRSPPEHQLDYDPTTLKMRSCAGWSDDALAREAQFLTDEAAKAGGQSGEFFWVFPPPRFV